MTKIGPGFVLGVAAASLLGAVARADGPPEHASSPTTEQADREADNIFLSVCGFCHADGGRRAGGAGPKLMDSPRSDDFIINRIKNGSEGKMPAFGAQFNDAQIQALLRHIRNLKPEN